MMESSHLNLVLLALATSALALVARIIYDGIRNPLSSLPGPWYTRWTDLVARYCRLTGQHAAYLHHLHQRYGPAVRVGPEEVAISDVHAARQIHRVVGPYRKAKWYDKQTVGIDPSIFSTRDVKLHSRHRRLLSSPMSEASLKQLEPLIDHRVRLAVRRMGGEMDQRGAADVFKWWTFMTNDIISELSFGESFEMLEQGKKNQYVHDLEEAASYGAIRSAVPQLTRLANVVPLPFLSGAIMSRNRLNAYAREAISRYRAALSADPSGTKPTFFTKLLKAGDGGGMSEAEVVGNSRTYILAGTDTTANTLTYLVWSVCRHDAVRRALIDELARLPPEFSDADLRPLAHLAHVIDETLRLYTAAPAALPREVPAGGADLAGHHIPAGVTVSTQAYTLHRDPEVFPNPETFDPSRWAEPTADMKNASMPFGGGSRICIGMHLARMELRLATARFFLAFPQAKVSSLEGMTDDDMEPKIFFLMAPKGRRCLIGPS